MDITTLVTGFHNNFRWNNMDIPARCMSGTCTNHAYYRLKFKSVYHKINLVCMLHLFVDADFVFLKAHGTSTGVTVSRVNCVGVLGVGSKNLPHFCG